MKLKLSFYLNNEATIINGVEEAIRLKEEIKWNKKNNHILKVNQLKDQLDDLYSCVTVRAFSSGKKL